MITIVVISKDEPALEYTLASLVAIKKQRDDVEILVVDASEGRLDYLRNDADVEWIDFTRPGGVRVSIPHQRNVGVAKAGGDIIVFTDAGCDPRPGWLDALTGPILSRQERVVAGMAMSSAGDGIYDADYLAEQDGYIEECPTICLAFERSVFDEVGGFDEGFQYGSDVDFAWRIRDAGTKIRRSTQAVVTHDWGTRARQTKRSYAYGRARAKLYRKHRSRRSAVLRNDPVAVIYPLFLIGLPLTLRYRAYPALLVVPMLKNRKNHSLRVVVDHLSYAAGVLREITGP